MADPQHALKLWLSQKLEAHGAITAAAEATGMSKDQLGRSKETEADDPKKRRRLQPHEIEALARHFNELPPGFEGMSNWLRLDRVTLAQSGEAQGPEKAFSTFDPDQPDVFDEETMTHGSETGLRGVPDGASPQLDVTAGMGAGGITVVSEGVRGKSGMTFAAEDISDYWRVPPVILASMGNVKPTDITFVPCQGDSMSPTLLEGDVVVVDTRHRWPSPDGLYALTDPFGGIIIKRLHVTDDGTDEERVVMVVSDNPKHETRKVTFSDLRIVGRVLRKFGIVG